jgi:hypothetical protein
MCTCRSRKQRRPHGFILTGNNKRMPVSAFITETVAWFDHAAHIFFLHIKIRCICRADKIFAQPYLHHLAAIDIRPRFGQQKVDLGLLKGNHQIRFQDNRIFGISPSVKNPVGTSTATTVFSGCSGILPNFIIAGKGFI